MITASLKLATSLFLALSLCTMKYLPSAIFFKYEPIGIKTVSARLLNHWQSVKGWLFGKSEKLFPLNQNERAPYMTSIWFWMSLSGFLNQ